MHAIQSSKPLAVNFPTSVGAQIKTLEVTIRYYVNFLEEHKKTARKAIRYRQLCMRDRLDPNPPFPNAMYLEHDVSALTSTQRRIAELITPKMKLYWLTVGRNDWHRNRRAVVIQSDIELMVQGTADTRRGIELIAQNDADHQANSMKRQMNRLK